MAKLEKKFAVYITELHTHLEKSYYNSGDNFNSLSKLFFLIKTKDRIHLSQQHRNFQFELIEYLRNLGESVTEIDVT
jgi:hypothetical protein